MEKIKDYTMGAIYATFYGITSAMGVQLLLQPTKIYTSGTMGFSQLIPNLLEKFAGIHTGVYFWYFILNLPIILVAWKRLGKRFTILSMLAVVTSSIFMKVIPLYTLTKDPMLASIFGGLLVGVGCGVCFRQGFSAGGTDIIALIIQKSTGKPVGQMGFLVNTCIIVIAGIVYGWELALYSIVSIYMTSVLVDKMYSQQQKITVTIYSHNIDVLAKALLKTIKRGITLNHNLEGGYSGNRIESATMVLTRYQLFFVRNVVKKVDPEAFINIQPTMMVMGNFEDNKKPEDK